MGMHDVGTGVACAAAQLRLGWLGADNPVDRPGARVDSVKLRYRSKPLRARVAGDPEAGRHRELSLQLDEPVDGAAPGQLACLMDGDLVVGWGTIVRGRG